MAEHGFFHPDRGYWQATSDVPEHILDAYPEGAVEVPLKPGAGYEWSGSEWVLDESYAENVLEAEQREAAKSYLDSTDWMVVRQVETGVPVPENITALRAQARDMWSQPQGAHDAYMKGDQVTIDGRTWESLIDFNVWEPGTSGWREVVSEGYAAWVQPTGAHDAYQIGDRVTHSGQTWESTHAANVWEPSVFGWSQV